MKRIDLKILLIKMGMTAGDLARRVGCHRCSIYIALSGRRLPGVLRKIRSWYDQNSRRVA